MEAGKLTIINLRDGGSISLPLFPNQIGTDDSVNYEAQDTVNGIKPLRYANREAQEISIDEVVIDNTRTNESVEPMIEKIRALAKEGRDGSPPPLQILTAGFQQRCVLKDVNVERNFFSKAGVAIRATLALTFWELQPTR